jgi:hemerythrin-like domain-containing protein
MTVPALAREDWATHPRFPAQTLLLEAHESFRKRAVWIRERVQAIDPSGPPGPSRPSGAAVLNRRQRWRLRMADDFAWWMKGMRGHERYEERKLYPFLARRYGVSFAALERAHRLLHEQEQVVTDAFGALAPGAADEPARHAALMAALCAYEDALRAHLATEEDLIIPMLLALEPSEFDAFRSGAAEPPALTPAPDAPAG